MTPRTTTAIGLLAVLLSAPALAQITFYEHDGYRGRVFSTDKAVGNFARAGFNDRASSVIVGSGRWEVCSDADFQGRCVVLGPGNYDSLGRMGLNDEVSSMRRVGRPPRGIEEAPPPPPEAPYAWRRRPGERIYQADVTAVHAVMGPPAERCWVEREQVAGDAGPQVGRGLVGALVGGVIGHQIGGGSGRDLATVGGVLAGAAIGAHSGRDGGAVSEHDVRHCETSASGPPAYWDVNYVFRGTPHRMQMAAAPGPTVPVNRQGEPRL